MLEARLSEPQRYIYNSPQKINLFMGGTGSGKTYLDGCLTSDFIKHYPAVYGFIGANTYEQLNTSTLKRIRDCWYDIHGWVEGEHYVVGKQPPKEFNTKNHNFDNYSSIISFVNGAAVFKGSLENYEVHSGKEFGWAILDESKDTREEAVKEVILHRLRQPGMGSNPLYITTTPAKVDWINDWFRLEDFEKDILSVIYEEDKYFYKEYDNKCVAICSIHHNRENLPEEYIENLITEHTDRNGKLKESGQRLIYANPFVKAGGEFYSSFDRMMHTTHIKPTPGLPLHISFDFNVVPYNTMLISQIERKEGIIYIRILGEICLESPNNKTDRLCEEFVNQYIDYLRAGLFYYGDASGKNQDTRGLNDWEVVAKSLRRHVNNFSKRVPYKNPPVLARRQFMNNIFDDKYNVRIVIDRKCKTLIRDLEFVKEDATGHKLRNKVKDKNTGQTYEKYTHTSDALDYLCTNIEQVKDIFKKELLK